MHIENQVNMAEAHTAFVVCKYINNIHIDVCAAYGVLTNNEDEYRIDIRLWDDIPELACQTCGSIELAQKYSIGIYGIQYVGYDPIGYIIEYDRKEFGFNTRKKGLVSYEDDVLRVTLYE